MLAAESTRSKNWHLAVVPGSPCPEAEKAEGALNIPLEWCGDWARICAMGRCGRPECICSCSAWGWGQAAGRICAAAVGPLVADLKQAVFDARRKAGAPRLFLVPQKAAPKWGSKSATNGGSFLGRYRRDARGRGGAKALTGSSGGRFRPLCGSGLLLEPLSVHFRGWVVQTQLGSASNKAF